MRRIPLRPLLASLAAAAALVAVALLRTASAETLNGHPVLRDAGGGLLPWTGLPVPTDGYDRVLRNAWDYLLHRVPDDPSTDRPAYFSQSYLDPETQQTSGWPSNPASMNAMLIESALAYYAYSGDAAVLAFARSLADHHLDSGLTPVGWEWPGVPYASGDAGSLVYQGAAYGDESGVGDGRGVIEPDKLGELGTSLLRLSEATGVARYRDAALTMAGVLASRVRSGDATHSPWPFRVEAETGVVREEYSAAVIAPIELFDELARRGLASAGMQAARATAWSWLLAVPMQNERWANYFEDVPIREDLDNVTQMSPLMTARYLLRHPELDPDWEAHVRGILDWVAQEFGVGSYGATTICEQSVFYHAMGSHTSRYASVQALLHAATGDAAAREEAYRSFNWATYMDRGDGVVIDGPEVGNQWFTDGYGDYIRHFLTGFAAIPEWAPAGEDHLTSSSSVVQAVHYAPGAVSYTTSDAPATDTLRLGFAPRSVTAGGQPLPKRSDLAQQGWSYDAATGVLRVRHDAATAVQVVPEPRAIAAGLAALLALAALRAPLPAARGAEQEQRRPHE